MGEIQAASGPGGEQHSEECECAGFSDCQEVPNPWDTKFP